MRKYLLLSIAFLFFVAQAFAQVDTGTISGTVHDSSGAVLAGATVKARNAETQAERSVQTNDSGQYTIPGLIPGTYDVTVTSGSFAAYKARTVITVGGHSSVDATMSVAGSETTVEVVGGAATEVNTQSQEISQVITPEQVEAFPSLTRNPYDFVATSGNIAAGDRTSTGGAQTIGSDRGVGFYINGQRSSGTEILLDGVENTDLFTTNVGQQVPQDAVREFRVITNNFEAQYGRASGGVVNVTTKSGNNNFHGSTWEFNRLSAYTANTYDNVANDNPKGKYTRNQFGYSVGGPVVKNKLFFFNTTEWLRVRSNAAATALVPTPQFLALTPANVQAFFTKYGAGAPTAVSTLTKQTQVINGVPTPVVGSTAGSPTGAFASVPDGTPVFGQVNFTAPIDAGGGVPTNSYQLVGRADYNMSDATQMFFRYALQSVKNFDGADFAGPYPQYNVGDKQYNNAFLYSVSHTFSQKVLSSTKLSFNRLNIAQSYNTELSSVPTLYLSNGASIGGKPVQLPGFFDQYTGVGGLPYGGPQNVIQVNEDVAWTKGAHTMRFGGQLNYEQINRAYGAYAQAIEQLGKNASQGLDNFLTGNLYMFQAAVNPQGHYPCVRDYVTGALIQTPNCTLTLPVGAPSFSRSYRYKDFALYAQDSWRFSDRLTLNYGMRYEFFGVQHNSNQALDSNFYYGSGTDEFQQIRNGSVQLAQNSPIKKLWNPNYGTVAPRVGFAYDVFGDGKTSLRGGLGMSYERNFGNVTFNMIQNPPNYAGVQLIGNLAGQVTTDNAGPFGGSSGTQVPLPPSSPRNVDQNIDTAQTQFWSLAVERELAKNTVFAIEYNGAHGVHLYDIKNINKLGGGNVWLGDQLAFVDPVTGKTTYNYSRLNQQFTTINNRGSQGYSHYNGVNFRFQTQNLHNTGITLVANYTWSHALDNISSTFSESASSSNGVGNLGYLDFTHPSLDYGNADFDVRHRVVISTIWDEPFFKNSKGLVHQVAGGWSVVPLFTIRSGAPFTVSDSSNSLNSLYGGIPRYTPSGTVSSYHTGSATYLSPNDFGLLSLPAALNWSNASLGGISDFGPFPNTMNARNAFYGPGAWNLDLALSKTFKLTERFGLEFRAEGFNVFNHHNMYVNGFNADASNFGGGAIVIDGKKGGLGQLANGGNHDERRFGQFALRLNF